MAKPLVVDLFPSSIILISRVEKNDLYRFILSKGDID